MRFPTMWYVQPARPQISLGIWKSHAATHIYVKDHPATIGKADQELGHLQKLNNIFLFTVNWPQSF